MYFSGLNIFFLILLHVTKHSLGIWRFIFCQVSSPVIQGPPVESSPSPTTSWSLATILVGVPLLASVLAIVARGSHRPPTLQWATMATSVEVTPAPPLDGGGLCGAPVCQKQMVSNRGLGRLLGTNGGGKVLLLFVWVLLWGGRSIAMEKQAQQAVGPTIWFANMVLVHFGGGIGG